MHFYAAYYECYLVNHVAQTIVNVNLGKFSLNTYIYLSEVGGIRYQKAHSLFLKEIYFLS